MRAMLRVLLLVMLSGIALVSASAQDICPARPQIGAPIVNPVDLFSQNGTLTVNLSMQNAIGGDGFEHYCYVYTYQGQPIEAPTLRVNPGDTLVVNLTNLLQPPPGPAKAKPMHMHKMSDGPADDCSGNDVVSTSTNIHFHGLNVPPVCHQDDVINTIIETGDPTFTYSIQIPANEPPGLYWYHPHMHGFTTQQVNGGASGAIIVEGNNPLVQGLTERILLMREQTKGNAPANDPDGNTQLTMNFGPAIYPEGGPAGTITMTPERANTGVSSTPPPSSSFPCS